MPLYLKRSVKINKNREMVTVTALMVSVYEGSFRGTFKSSCFLNKKGLHKDMSLLEIKP